MTLLRSPGAGRPSPALTALLLGGLLSLAPLGCSLPTFKGAQLQETFPGFLRVPDAPQGRRMFPDREQIHYDVWVNSTWGEISTIHINGHAGPVMRADVQGALENAERLVGDSVTFSGLQQFVIDGRTGWGWSERLQSVERGLEWVGFRVAVPYDTITYTVEVWSGDPALKRSPDTLVAMASTFGVGEVTWNIPLIVGIVAGAALLVGFMRKRSRERAERMQKIRFVKIPKKEEEEEGPAPEGTAKGAPPTRVTRE